MALYLVSGINDKQQQGGVNLGTTAADFIAPGSGQLLTQLGLDKLFTQAGVDSSFFSQYPFFSFLDNSTHQWKSRVAKLRNLPADQILAWYLKGQQDGGFDIIDAEQYANQWSHKPDPDKVINNDSNVTYELAAAYNRLLEDKYFKGRDIAPGTNWSRRDLMIFLPDTINYPGAGASSLMISPLGEKKILSGFSKNKILIAGLITVGAFMLLNSFKNFKK